MVDLLRQRAPARCRALLPYSGGVIEAGTRLRPTSSSAGEARRFARTTLHAWGLDRHADLVELLISELVTNAILHARSEVELLLSSSDDTLRVDVTDTSSAPPVLRNPGDGAMTGRGLALVAELSTEWGVTSTAHGKSVWFVVAA